MKLKRYGKEQVASALVEIFDRIYPRPLLSWRAFASSMPFTTVISVVFIFELGVWPVDWNFSLQVMLVVLLTNVFSDYIPLFVIRPSYIPHPDLAKSRCIRV
jgi:hypothetical protein